MKDITKIADRIATMRPAYKSTERLPVTVYFEKKEELEIVAPLLIELSKRRALSDFVRKAIIEAVQKELS